MKYHSQEEVWADVVDNGRLVQEVKFSDLVSEADFLLYGRMAVERIHSQIKDDEEEYQKVLGLLQSGEMYSRMSCDILSLKDKAFIDYRVNFQHRERHYTDAAKCGTLRMLDWKVLVLYDTCKGLDSSTQLSEFDGRVDVDAKKWVQKFCTS